MNPYVRATLGGAYYDAARSAYDWAVKKYRGPIRRKPRKIGFVKRVKKIVSGQAELKTHDTSVSNNTAVGGTSFIQPLTLIAQGDDFDEREGLEIYIQSVQIIGRILGDSDVGKPTTIRLVLFQAKKQLDGVIPTVLQLYVSDSVRSLRSHLNRTDFRVLWDSYANITDWHDTATHQAEMLVKYYKKFKKPLKATYNTTTGVIGAVDTGHLFLLMQTDQATTFQPSWSMGVRVNFKDM